MATTTATPAAPSVKVTKSFTHNGTTYNVGDTFTGSAYDCQLLIAQGFAAQPAAKWGGTPPQAAPAQTGTSSIY